MRAITFRRRLRVAGAYVARIAMSSLSVLFRVLPRARKITMLTREHSRPPLDFLLLEESIRRQDPTITVVLIARMVPTGLARKLAYAFHLVGDLWHAATSRVLVVDGYSPVASASRHGPGLAIVQVWHALGALKKFGLSILGRDEGREPGLARAVRMHQGYDLVLASAERCRAPYAEAFGTDISQIVVAPLPRVDRLRDASARERVRARFLERYPELAGEMIALFAPTFRSGRDQPVDPLELTDELRGIGYATVVKTHPLMAPLPTRVGLNTAPGFSTLDMIMIADVFITDYSSAIFEAAVAGVPSYLISTDLSYYSSARDFYLDYPKDLGVPLSTSVAELVEAIDGDSGGAERMSDLVRLFVEGDQESATANSDAIATLLIGLIDR